MCAANYCESVLLIIKTNYAWVSPKTFSVVGILHFVFEILKFNFFSMSMYLCSVCIFFNNACKMGKVSKGLVKD